MIEFVFGMFFGVFTIHVLMDAERRKNLFNALDIKGLMKKNDKNGN